jgi:hypothetical protein
MWHIQAQIAMDIARERSREAQDRARAAEARRAMPGSTPWVRAAMGAVLRGASDVLDSASTAACKAAARVDRPTA